jgi:outer membrane protein TolC
MKLLTKVLSALSLLLSLAAQGQSLTLEQLIDKALTNNLSVQAARFDEAKTEARISEVKAGALPSVNLTGDYKRYLKIPGQVVPASAFGGQEGTYQVLAFGLPYNLSTSVQASQAIYNPSLTIGLKAAKTSREVSTLQTRQTKEDVAYNADDSAANGFPASEHCLVGSADSDY